MVSCLDHSGWSQGLRRVQLPRTRGRFGVKTLSWTWDSHQCEHQRDKMRRCPAGLGVPQIPRVGRASWLGEGKRCAPCAQAQPWPGAPGAEQREAH